MARQSIPTKAQEAQTRVAEVEDPHPTPISSYIGVGIMAFFAAIMAIVVQTSGGSSLY